jgi:hypothetical protein
MPRCGGWWIQPARWRRNGRGRAGVAQSFQPGRAEDRRGGFLVPGADLAQRFGSSHGVIEGVFALHDDIDVDDR